jgi:hypothetical protein
VEAKSPPKQQVERKEVMELEGEGSLAEEEVG